MVYTQKLIYSKPEDMERTLLSNKAKEDLVTHILSQELFTTGWPATTGPTL